MERGRGECPTSSEPSRRKSEAAEQASARFGVSPPESMTDQRQHRGPHPRDESLFGVPFHAVLREAAAHFAWLLERGYSSEAALKLVGDHFSLTVRQRQALQRGTCGDTALNRRAARQLAPSDVAGRVLLVDGFNVLISIEAALSGGLVLIGRDGVHRDLASVHGTYRAVSETPKAIEQWITATCALAPTSVHVYLDAPVSNSGRLAQLIRSSCPANAWQVELVANPDSVLKSAHEGVIASSDGIILEQCNEWIDLVAWTIEYHQINCWKLDMRSE